MILLIFVLLFLVGFSVGFFVNEYVLPTLESDKKVSFEAQGRSINISLKGSISSVDPLPYNGEEEGGEEDNEPVEEELKAYG